jgi:N-acetylmuramoyl-L-alanine amidase
MTNLWQYLFESNMILTISYLFFLCLYSKKTFLKTNRFILIAGIVISYLIPLISISAKTFSPVIGTVLFDISNEIIPFHEDNASGGQVHPTANIGLNLICILVYITGAAAVAFRIIAGVFHIRCLQVCRKVRVGNARVYIMSKGKTFSFFNCLYLSTSENSRAIIQHEKAHLKQWHWIDLLMSEFLVVTFWFNPISWAYRKHIRQQHEYLADDYVLKQGTSPTEYLQLILRTLSTEKPIGLINQFSSNSLKNRIQMMTKNRSMKKSKALYLLTLPLLCLLIVAFSNRPAPKVTSALTVVIDASHGGEDPGGTFAGIQEKDIVLSIARLLQLACEERGIIVVQTRTTDKARSLTDRISLADKSGADLFISLHVASSSDPQANGIDCLVNRDNPAYDKSVRVGSAILRKLKTVGTVNGINNSEALVIKKNPRAAVLLELGYLTNESDRKWITNAANQTKIAELIAQAVSEY